MTADRIAYEVDRLEMYRKQAIALLGEPTEREPRRVPISERDRRSPRYLAVQLLRERDGSACYLCGRELDPDQSCIEHIIPIAHGGANEPANVAIACLSCNSRKNDSYVSLTSPSGTPLYHQPR